MNKKSEFNTDTLPAIMIVMIFYTVIYLAGENSKLVNSSDIQAPYKTASNSY